MSDPTQSQPEFSEEELRALEAELERITIDEVILQTIVSLVNLGARKAAIGAPPGSGATADWGQVHDAIEAVRALIGVIESRHSDKLGPIRDAVSQLQLAYARGTGAAGQEGGGAPQGGAGEGAPGEKGGEGTGPAQSSGRLWVPGQ